MTRSKVHPVKTGIAGLLAAIAATFLWVGPALAQADEDAAPTGDAAGEATGDEEPTDGGDDGSGDSDSTAEEKEAPKASPDVQKFVGKGTEKAKDEEDEPPPEEPKKEPKKKPAVEPESEYSHKMQPGLRAAYLGGYRMIFRYDESPLCNPEDVGVPPADQKKSCGHAAPGALDLAFTFGVLDSLEPYLWVKLGLGQEDETDTAPVRIVGIGTRIYTMPTSQFKIYLEPAIGVEFEGQGDIDVYNDSFEYKTDTVFHFGFGPQYDFTPWLGVYIHGGMTVGILRSINGTLEYGGGLQLRAP